MISQFDYNYSPVGQIVSCTQADSGMANLRRYDFGYDAADQLKGGQAQSSLLKQSGRIG